MKTLRRLWNEEEAANAVEYGLVAAVIAVGLIFAFTRFRTEIAGLFNRQSDQVSRQ